MARINVEDELWSDQRFLRLCIRLQDEVKAVGFVVLAWKLAQKHWCPDKAPVPETEWASNNLPEALIEVGLAERRDAGIYMRGSEECFAWWFLRQEAGRKGGINSGEARRSKSKQSLARRSKSKQTQANEPSSSSSLSFSSSSSDSKEKDLKATEVSVRPHDQGSEIGLFIAKYVLAFQKRFPPPARPNLVGKVQGEIRRFLKDTPLERAINLIEVYFQMEDEWFKTKSYDFTTFIENLQKVSIALDTGQIPGKPVRKSIAELLKEKGA
jgi:hypothetical protein